MSLLAIQNALLNTNLRQIEGIETLSISFKVQRIFQDIPLLRFKSFSKTITIFEAYSTTSSSEKGQKRDRYWQNRGAMRTMNRAQQSPYFTDYQTLKCNIKFCKVGRMCPSFPLQLS
jgi:hypothetical protein